MKDSIFTPGPWTQHNTTWEDGDGNTIMPIISDSPDMVGQRLVALVRDRKDNGLTNATLIAAAPEMLEALKGVLDLEVIPHNGEHGSGALLRQVLQDVRATLAKAEGR